MMILDLDSLEKEVLLSVVRVFKTCGKLSGVITNAYMNSQAITADSIEKHLDKDEITVTLWSKEDQEFTAFMFKELGNQLVYGSKALQHNMEEVKAITPTIPVPKPVISSNINTDNIGSPPDHLVRTFLFRNDLGINEHFKVVSNWKGKPNDYKGAFFVNHNYKLRRANTSGGISNSIMWKLLSGQYYVTHIPTESKKPKPEEEKPGVAVNEADIMVLSPSSGQVQKFLRDNGILINQEFTVVNPNEDPKDMDSIKGWYNKGRFFINYDYKLYNRKSKPSGHSCDSIMQKLISSEYSAAGYFAPVTSEDSTDKSIVNAKNISMIVDDQNAMDNEEARKLLNSDTGKPDSPTAYPSAVEVQSFLTEHGLLINQVFSMRFPADTVENNEHFESKVYVDGNYRLCKEYDYPNDPVDRLQSQVTPYLWSTIAGKHYLLKLLTGEYAVGEQFPVSPYRKG